MKAQLTHHLQRAWLHRGPLACLLWPLSQIYGLVNALRRELFRRGWLKSENAPVPVLVVGNLVAGGAGKTPLVMALVRHLQASGRQPGVVSRGYGRQSEQCLEVLPKMSANLCGDEPLLIRQSTGAPVFVAHRRIDALRALLQAHPHTDLVICDDGLQHYALRRDLNIAVFDDRGIGNGISLIIFTGIVAEIPRALAQFFSQGRAGVISTPVIILVIVMVVAVIAFVVFMERALRKIHIQYPRRTVGMKVYDGGSSHLPIKVNPAGVIPAIFASSLLLLPVTISTFSGSAGTGPIMSTILAYFGHGQPLYLLFLVVMIVFFAYFYTNNVAFKTDEVAENLRSQGGFIPGIRPGKKTEEYLDYVVTRILVIGSAYLAAVCLLPEILIKQFSIPFYFGGTSVLIVVSVTMDTINQLQSHLLAHQYEGLIEKSQLRGKKRSTAPKPPARR